MNNLKVKAKPEKDFVQSVKQVLLFLLVSILISGYASAQLPTLEWGRASIGGSDQDKVNAVATDSQGNVYSTGFFSGTADFDPGPNSLYLNENGGGDVFVQKLDANGNLLWAKTIGGPSSEQGTSITVDSNGGVCVTGYFLATVDFDPSSDTLYLTSNGAFDLFILKLDANGDFLWAKSIGGAEHDAGYSITTDAVGNFYFTGKFSGTVDFDPGPGMMNVVSVGVSDAFVQKLDANGNLVWVRSIDGTDLDIGTSIAIDSSGIYATGTFGQTADFDPGVGVFNLVSNGNFDFFVQKLDHNGDFIWAKSIGGSGWDYVNSIATDMNGNIYTTGTFIDSIDFDPGSGTSYLSGNGTETIYVQKLDGNGNFLWANVFEGSGQGLGESISTDSEGNTYSTGRFNGTLDFDSGMGTMNLTSVGLWDSYVQKLAPNGDHIWTFNSEGVQSEMGNSVATDVAGNVIVGGYFGGTVDFDPGPGMMNSTSNGNTDGFIQKIASEVCQIVTSIDVQSACDSYTWIDGNTYMSSNNTATDTLTNVMGCDSIITLNLTINSVSNVGVMSSAATLTADLSPGIGISYNWLDCDNNFSPVGIVTQSFSPTSNGNYAVEIVENQCVDTSACLTVDNVSLDVNVLDLVSIVPNPTQDIVKLVLNDSDVRLTILDVNGKIMDEFAVSSGSEVDIFHYDTGVYFFWLKSDEFEIVKRVLKY